MQLIKRTQKARRRYGKETLSYTVTSRELVRQVPMVARLRAASLGDKSPNTPLKCKSILFSNNSKFTGQFIIIPIRVLVKLFNNKIGFYHSVNNFT